MQNLNCGNRTHTVAISDSDHGSQVPRRRCRQQLALASRTLVYSAGHMIIQTSRTTAEQVFTEASQFGTVPAGFILKHDRTRTSSRFHFETQ
ncbi:uncharacterized protein MEPE_04026 [Melanopsichium pennsylvanicum]|uniref:Uncharacterized protein n=1 Tax=Melanopsichium pennsylvanicum TaxID=63383 RepID=A0AAJ4XP33_9BASI|nr:uncharacterized protein MEPE_04026 [Melanopsichium pennsylvanicum]